MNNKICENDREGKVLSFGKIFKFLKFKKHFGFKMLSECI